MADCLFCNIIAGSIPSNKVYEDETVFAFRDIAPQAPTHILVIPKVHLDSVDAVTPENSPVVAHIFEVIPRIAKASGLTEKEIKDIVSENTQGKVLGIFGEETVNVLKVNIEIAQRMGIL